MKNLSKIVSALLVAGLLPGCANDRNEVNRIYVEAMNLPAVSRSETTLSLYAADARPACSVLDELGAEKITGPAFRVFGALLEDGRGAIDLNDSPFTLMVLGEKFTLDDEAAFYKMAEAERAAGRLGAMKWFMLKFMNGIGALRSVQFKATNEKLEENFPGMFGHAKPVVGSLPWRLAERAADLKAVGAVETKRLLTLRLPLFSGAQWDDASAQMRTTLSAAVAALGQQKDQRERLCGHVLLQHHFAQLLSLKGFRAAVTQPVGLGRNFPWVKLLSAEQPEFAERVITGAFLKDGAATNLESDGITAYDPTQNALGVRALPPGMGDGAVGDLSSALAMMEGLLYGFEATSPASPWVVTNGYWLGDIQSSEGKALLPAEAHALELGLLTVHFKNLAYRHIRKVGRDGVLVREGEAPAGFVLDAEGGVPELATVRLSELMRLSRVATHLEAALERFFGKDPIHWEQLNPVYNHQTLGALLGLEYFDPNAKGPTAADPLRKSLRSLRLPLALLMAEMGSGGCKAEYEWQLSSGQRTSVRDCTAEEKIALVDTLKTMAAETGSALLQRKAEEIERE